MLENAIEQVLAEWTLYAASIVEAVAVLIIAAAVVQVTIRLVIFAARRESHHHLIEQARLSLGRWLILSLEFLIAADILRTAVAPSWNEIGQLAAIIALRVILSYSLEHDIDKAAAEQAAD